MTIQIRRNPQDHLLELGGGSHPVVNPRCLGGQDVHVDIRMCRDREGRATVDFTMDFSQFPWPISSEEWEGVISIFAIEHLSYLHTKDFLKEILRVLKPGGKLLLVLPNTEAQLKWILEHPEGWDSKDLFLAASEKLFGDQAHSSREGEPQLGVDSHKAYFSPRIIIQHLQEAGFVNIITQPYGERQTDLAVEALKPSSTPENPSNSTQAERSPPEAEKLGTTEEPPVQTKLRNYPRTTEERQKVYSKSFFDSYQHRGFVWHYPWNESIAKRVLEREPQSVLELGCGRGYVLKKLEDAGIPCLGLDVSKHAHMTRVTDKVYLHDLCQTWSVVKDSFDFCLSIQFLEHIPEEFLLPVVQEMQRVCKRGLHAITFFEDGMDSTRCTLHPKEWWQERLPEGHEVLTYQELAGGELPEELFYPSMPGKCANLGCAWTMVHHGWDNVDLLDLKDFARANKYKFLQHDLRNGLPYKTGECSLLFLSHVLEHFTYQEGLRLLKECRRVIRPDGAIRILVPDAKMLMNLYANGGRPAKYDERNEGYEFEPGLERFDEINQSCADSPSDAGKLWALLHEGHQSCYDHETLSHVLKEAGFTPHRASFRQTEVEPIKQLLKDTVEMSYGELSLFMDATPLLG